LFFTVVILHIIEGIQFGKLKREVSNLDHKSNFITTVAVVVGGLSLTDKITFIIGLIVLVMAGISNYFSFKKNKQSYENEKRKSKLMDKYEE